MTLPDGIHDVPAGKIAAVVTSLEMLARVPARPEPASPLLQLRRVATVDHAWYRRLYSAVGADWLWYSRLRMSDTELAAIVSDPDVEIFALEQAGRETGLLELDFRRAGQCELGFLGLAPPAIGTGAGRWLMNRAVARAWSRPIARFWVHTCTLDHPDALDFYCRSGFRPVRRQIEIADDPRLTGVLPRNAALQVPIL